MRGQNKNKKSYLHINKYDKIYELRRKAERQQY